MIIPNFISTELTPKWKIPKPPKPVGIIWINEEATKINKHSINVNSKEGNINWIKKTFIQYINQINIEEKITALLLDKLIAVNPFQNSLKIFWILKGMKNLMQ